MRFEILNVDRGFCAYAQGDNGQALLIDCGYGSNCRPSSYLPTRGITTVSRLFVTNYDEGNIGDLPAIRQNLEIEGLMTNSSITSAQIRSLKAPPLSAAMTELLGLLESIPNNAHSEQFEPAGLRFWAFHNDYPDFTDTKNLSLLTFLDVGNRSFVLGGDLGNRGWLKLLDNPQVRYLLMRVDVLVASQHGRETGYCPEVFDYCKPSMVVIADAQTRDDTEQMANIYARHASGQLFGQHSRQEMRKIATTRNDGNIWWDL